MILLHAHYAEFHIGWLRAHGKRDLKELPPAKWFCSDECMELNTDVKVLVALGAQKVPDTLMGNYATNCDAEWRIVRGKHTTEENSLLLDEAAKIFYVGFNPMVAFTGTSLLEKEVPEGQRLL
ncbi:uncharacterized protein LOC143618827 [Bidens hawaiensis]|uniref:uncharacterized protein LOC143618827 n=1 Tax=Bidens hawaiensis TaxID=980011 RepID=UPI00404A5F0A